MDARENSPLPLDALDQVFDKAADAMAQSIVEGLACPATEAAARAERVDLRALKFLLRLTAARLRLSCPQGCA